MPGTINLENKHDVSVINLRKIAGSLGLPFPTSICLITVEVRELYLLAERLTQEMENQIGEISQKVKDLIVNHENLVSKEE